MAGDSNFLPNREIRRASLNFEARVHFSAVPVRHSLRDEENENIIRRDGEIDCEIEFRHAGSVDVDEDERHIVRGRTFTPVRNAVQDALLHFAERQFRRFADVFLHAFDA